MMIRLMLFRKLLGSLLLLLCTQFSYGQKVRKTIALNTGWQTIMDQNDSARYAGFQSKAFKTDGDWQKVNVPHNWDRYEGYRRLLHGNLHGYSWYRKQFSLKHPQAKNRFFLFFEGVGSYATVWLNGKQVGYHAGGRTTFTLDVTDAIKLDGSPNLLAVRADHPAHITDLPWVDGGCSTERGFSEGSQPMGIFRPVSLVIKNEVSIVPFGEHYWNDETADSKKAIVHQSVEVANQSKGNKKIEVISRVFDQNGKMILRSIHPDQIEANTIKKIRLKDLILSNPHLWSIESPYLYQIKMQITVDGQIKDEVQTAYGIRTVRWSKGLKPSGDTRLLINGKPTFINGIAEYEHKLGQSHAFPEEEIEARVKQIRQLGFNSFRDAHQPHNLRYQAAWDRYGILLWTQLAAHIWFDTPAFRNNFKRLLTEWVRERRNSPSVILWGLENESTLPEDFAQECTALIRELDPTASIQRLVTTCNGGSGTDWDVPQNWTGTYGGNQNTYGEDLKKQLLVGEYGAWRSLGLHAEPPYLPNENNYNEERFADILQTKIRLADSVKDSAVGHYLWLWNSHDNPGRVQGGEGNRELDRIGPVNYKGILTPWGEPTDAFYMYMSHYSSKVRPMVYIAMHSWPNRWLKPGIKNNIRIFSNCEEVELFNDLGTLSLGRKPHPGFGRHIEFDAVDIRYNVLYAEGRIAGKIVSRDTIILENLPASPRFETLYTPGDELLKAASDYHYVYRVNCGGDHYVDKFGAHWKADQPYSPAMGWGSRSWADHFEGMNSKFASQRMIFDPIKGTKDWRLFQTFRYGLDQLNYQFDLPNGDYLVELFFAEPWYGKFSSGQGDRIFDIAINGDIVEHKLDLYKASGYQQAFKRSYSIKVRDRKILIDFPHVYAGQALIQAIAIASKQKVEKEPIASGHYNLSIPDQHIQLHSWLDIGSVLDSKASVKTAFFTVPPSLYGSDYFSLDGGRSYSLRFNEPTSVFWLAKSRPDGFEVTKDRVQMSTGDYLDVYRKVADRGAEIKVSAKNRGEVLAFQQQSGLLPVYDLKEVKNYKAYLSDWREGVSEVEFSGQKRLVFSTDAEGYVAWQFQVGAADIYSLTIKYHNPAQESHVGYYEILDKNKQVLVPKTPIRLEPTRAGKWNYISTDTKTMINAGTYFIKFYAVHAKDLMVDNLEVK
ncbi:malectin domain-containing carbohydrate-binding protein [Sphingobacterium thalpophilum]|uniref:malectin domain-containing carbohydrate-binding protein n=1 Tax=Sphingobacterium thalpophilum TaxID=259 RepID=UPI002D79AEE1|nr:malectin domain-containing carbohydrate-binding protein [Sphingobacterium thalpophilum]